MNRPGGVVTVTEGGNGPPGREAPMSVHDRLLEAAKTLTRANIARAEAERLEKSARADFEALADEAGEDVVVIDDGDLAGAKVALVTSDRVTYDTDALKGFVGGGITQGAWLLVTNRVIDPKALREAGRVGRIDPLVIDKVAIHQTVRSVRVTVPKGA
jgi:hypothetical protein